MIKAFPLLAAAVLSFSTSLYGADKKPVDAGPYVPSPTSVVADMLTLADVGPKDFVIDLGSGDGRIVLTAAKVFGARGFGVDINEKLVKEANKLLGELNPGTRILSHDYPLSGWIPEKYVQMDLEDKVAISGVTTTLIYLYVVPAKADGTWNARLPASLSKEPVRFTLKQQITRVAGAARIGGREVLLEEARLRGERLSFRLALGSKTYEFTGTVKGNAIDGSIVDAAGTKTAWSATK
jgi:hypothetical protein